MKRKTVYPLAFTLLLSTMVFLLGCDKEENNNNNNNNADMWNINATLSGTQEVPSNPSTATGRVTGTYNATSNELQYNVSWTGLTGAATAGHFHGPALAGVNASPIIYFNLVNNGTAGSATGTVTLTDAQEADVLAGKWYANIHTATYGGGEIRGQLALSK